MMRFVINALFRACRFPFSRRCAAVYAYALLYILSWFLPASAVEDVPTAKSPVTKTMLIGKQMGHSLSTPAGNVLAAFTVEVVSSIASREKGLSGRDRLPLDSGMLFVLDDEYAPSIWMKGMRFPIDIIFFDKDRKVIEVMKNLQPCTDCRIYEGPPNSAYVLEINAGQTEKNGISAGNHFSLEE